MSDDLWGLADAIAALRRELAKAMESGEGQRIKFRLQPVEITIQAVVTKGADGRIGWSVIGIGGKAESARTHALKVILQPLVRTETGEYTSEYSITDLTEEPVHFGTPPDGK
jgi:hypothetical protein